MAGIVGTILASKALPLILGGISTGAGVANRFLAGRDQDKFNKRLRQDTATSNLVGALTRGRFVPAVSTQPKQSGLTKFTGALAEGAGLANSVLGLGRGVSNLIDEQKFRSGQRAFQTAQQLGTLHGATADLGSQRGLQAAPVPQRGAPTLGTRSLSSGSIGLSPSSGVFGSPNDRSAAPLRPSVPQAPPRQILGDPSAGVDLSDTGRAFAQLAIDDRFAQRDKAQVLELTRQQKAENDAFDREIKTMDLALRQSGALLDIAKLEQDIARRRIEDLRNDRSEVRSIKTDVYDQIGRNGTVRNAQSVQGFALRTLSFIDELKIDPGNVQAQNGVIGGLRRIITPEALSDTEFARELGGASQIERFISILDNDLATGSIQPRVLDNAARLVETVFRDQNERIGFLSQNLINDLAGSDMARLNFTINPHDAAGLWRPEEIEVLRVQRMQAITDTLNRRSQQAQTRTGLPDIRALGRLVPTTGSFFPR